ncbi:Rossmann-like and DUF2520 domain-containing protein [Myroides injenensis]|uniref:Rossmann-like and DUF2520 domain-containing protein n=1 Tax=Myroides injenensis TaxID=1183151 RepID=UPI0002889BB6|nr:DUF2520 domain-containing protein [Myroides injenensis]
MTTITILGAGKVAKHLILNILEHDNLQLQQIYARNSNKIKEVVDEAKIVNDIKDLKPADIFIIAVSDNAIEEVTSSFPLENQLLIHTSGTMPLSVIKNTDRKGVFYMLQSFSFDKSLDFSEIPFCLEASNPNDFKTLENLAVKFSEKVYKINSEQRKAIHLAAVFVNNFANHMFVLGEEICKENSVPFEILKPLIFETTKKIEHLSPLEAQTGPAARRDLQTIEQHQELLKDANKKEIYNLITKSILKK